MSGIPDRRACRRQATIHFNELTHSACYDHQAKDMPLRAPQRTKAQESECDHCDPGSIIAAD